MGTGSRMSDPTEIKLGEKGWITDLPAVPFETDAEAYAFEASIERRQPRRLFTSDEFQRMISYEIFALGERVNLVDGRAAGIVRLANSEWARG